MRRSDLNFWIDAVAFALFVFLVATGVIMEFLLPAGSGHSTTLWGLDRHEWGGIHFWVSVGFLASLALHVYLHWKWVVSVVRGRPREGSGARVGLGVLGLVALLAVAVAPLVTPVERGESGRSGVEPRWGLSAESEQIQGSMTLGDVVDATGITLELLAQQLGLPNDIEPDDRVGRIARDNGISVAEVREAVERALASELEPRSESTREPLTTVETVTQPTTIEEIPASPEEAAADHPEHSDHEDTQAGLADIRGAMTLSDIIALGVPREVLYRELGIPAGIRTGERLGRLGRTYGFSMTQVRDLVEAQR